MRKSKSPSRRFAESELAALRAVAHWPNAPALERAEALLLTHAADLNADEMIEALRLCAQGCQAAGRTLDALRLLRRGLELAVRERRQHDRVALLAAVADAHQSLHNDAAAVRALREALAIAERDGYGDEQARISVLLGALYADLDLHADAVALLERVPAFAISKRQHDIRVAALDHLARSLCALGRFAEAEQAITEAAAAARGGTSRELVAALQVTAAEIKAARGDLATATRVAAAAADVLRTRHDVPTLLRLLLASARWLLALGRHDEGRARLEEAALLPSDQVPLTAREEVAALHVQLERAAESPERALAAVTALLAARADARRAERAARRTSVQFIEAPTHSEHRVQRAAAAANELTLRLIETEAEVQRAARQNARDPLTGALHQAALTAAIAKVAGGAQQPTTLLLIDVDDFAAINERHGHVAGDAVLVGVTERLRQALRVNDLVGRVGDDEFLVLCPDVGPRVAVTIAARVLDKVRAAPIVHDGEPIAVRVSVGAVCTHSQSLGALPYLRKRLDAAMARAKRDGKDRAVTVRVND